MSDFNPFKNWYPDLNFHFLHEICSGSCIFGGEIIDIEHKLDVKIESLILTLWDREKNTPWFPWEDDWAVFLGDSSSLRQKLLSLLHQTEAALPL